MLEKKKSNNEIDENSLEDKRNEISENIFIELDICAKAYSDSFSQDRIFEDLEFIVSNFAFILRSHENVHNLYDVDIHKLKIPESKYVNQEGEIIDSIINLKTEDKINYIANLLLNSQLGISELKRSEYFNGINDSGFLMPISKVIWHIDNKIDETLLRMNNVLNKI